jgi:hypothetical protein
VWLWLGWLWLWLVGLGAGWYGPDGLALAGLALIGLAALVILTTRNIFLYLFFKISYLCNYFLKYFKIFIFY